MEFLDDNEFVIRLYLGGKSGRFLNDRLGVVAASFYLSLVLTTIGIEYYYAQNAKFTERTDFVIAYIVLCFLIDYLLFTKIFTRIFWKVMELLYTPWSHWVENKPTKLYEFSNRQHPDTGDHFLKITLPSSLILGLKFDRGTLYIYDFGYNALHIRGNGKLADADGEQMLELIANHLGLTKKEEETFDETYDYQYINQSLLNKSKQEREDMASDVNEHLMTQRRSLDKSATRTPFLTFLWGVINFVFSLALVEALDAAESVFTFALIFLPLSFFIVNTGFTILQAHFLVDQDSVYETI